MNDDDENNNIVKFGTVQGGKAQTEDESIPVNEYVIVTRTDDGGTEEHYAEGFLLFTSQHIAVMRDTGAGALPVLVVPLTQVLLAQLVEDDEILDDEIPF